MHGTLEQPDCYWEWPIRTCVVQMVLLKPREEKHLGLGVLERGLGRNFQVQIPV